MKKYPYTNSTELVAYRPKIKRHRFRMFLPCLISAFLASAITAGALFGTYQYYIKPAEREAVSSDTEIKVEKANRIKTSQRGATTLAYGSGDEGLTIPEIAKLVGPSCVGIINKAKLQ